MKDSRRGSRVSEKDAEREERAYSSASQTLSVVQLGTGAFLRALCAFALTFGALLYVNDALALDIGFFVLLFYSALSVAAFSLIPSGGKRSLIGLGILLAAVGVSVLLHPNIFGFCRESVRYTFDSAMRLLAERGFENYNSYITGSAGLGLEEDVLYRGALALLAVLLGALFSLCLMRRTVLIPVLAAELCVLVPGFTFNLSSSNIGLAVIIVAIAGAVAMRVSDARFRAHKGERATVAALGGYAGGLMMLIALLSVAIPALAVKEQWRDIPAISQPVEVARDVVDSVISGEEPDLFGVGILKNMDSSNSRDASVKKRSYTGKTLMTVRTSQGSRLGIYLRGWVASSFDGNSWLSATDGELAEYKEELSDIAEDAGYELGGDTYSSDMMADALLDLLPSVYLSQGSGEGGASSLLGYTGIYTDIKLKNGVGTGNLMFVPAMFSAEGGVWRYGNTAKGYSRRFRSYLDGIYTTGWLNLSKKYSALAYVPQMSDASFGASLQAQLDYYSAMRTLMTAHASGQYTEEALRAMQAQLISELGVELGEGEETYFDRYLAMDGAEREQALARYVTLVDAYTEYAVQKYGSGASCDIPAIRTAAEKILEGISADASVHAKTLAAVQYVLDNYSYSKDPKLPSSLSGYEAFLRETREGDHVQLATTLTLILREMGITARYVEGYLASDFRDGDGSAVCEITDEDAHAWVEVYYEGLGWVPYEAVKKYAKAYYGGNISASAGASGNIGGGGSYSGGYEAGDSDGELTPETPITELPEDEGGLGGGALFAILAVIALCVGAVVLQRRTRERSAVAVAKRKQLIDDAVGGRLEGEELTRTAGAISSEVLGMLSVAGYAAERGELPMEYAERIESDCPYSGSASFTEIMELIQKQEFGEGVSAEELTRVGGYLDGLWRELYTSSSGAKRFWYRYVKRRI